MEQTDNQIESFLEKVRSFDVRKRGKDSILTPYRERILSAYNSGLPIPSILKALENEGVKTSYVNLRAYVLRHKKREEKKLGK